MKQIFNWWHARVIGKKCLTVVRVRFLQYRSRTWLMTSGLQWFLSILRLLFPRECLGRLTHNGRKRTRVELSCSRALERFAAVGKNANVFFAFALFSLPPSFLKTRHNSPRPRSTLLNLKYFCIRTYQDERPYPCRPYSGPSVSSFEWKWRLACSAFELVRWIAVISWQRWKVLWCMETVKVRAIILTFSNCNVIAFVFPLYASASLVVAPLCPILLRRTGSVVSSYRLSTVLDLALVCCTSFYLAVHQLSCWCGIC